jgi:chromosome segregation ATPase
MAQLRTTEVVLSEMRSAAAAATERAEALASDVGSKQAELTRALKQLHAAHVQLADAATAAEEGRARFAACEGACAALRDQVDRLSASESNNAVLTHANHALAESAAALKAAAAEARERAARAEADAAQRVAAAEELAQAEAGQKDALLTRVARLEAQLQATHALVSDSQLRKGLSDARLGQATSDSRGTAHHSEMLAQELGILRAEYDGLREREAELRETLRAYHKAEEERSKAASAQSADMRAALLALQFDHNELVRTHADVSRELAQERAARASADAAAKLKLEGAQMKLSAERAETQRLGVRCSSLEGEGRVTAELVAELRQREVALADTIVQLEGRNATLAEAQQRAAAEAATLREIVADLKRTGDDADRLEHHLVPSLQRRIRSLEEASQSGAADYTALQQSFHSLMQRFDAQVELSNQQEGRLKAALAALERKTDEAELIKRCLEDELAKPAHAAAPAPLPVAPERSIDAMEMPRCAHCMATLGDADELRAHEDQCDFRAVRCAECAEEVLAMHLERHMATVCGLRAGDADADAEADGFSDALTKCPKCERVVAPSSLARHLKEARRHTLGLLGAPPYWRRKRACDQAAPALARVCAIIPARARAHRAGPVGPIDPRVL